MPETQVAITKRALKTTIRLGETIPYRITVANRGAAATAENVIVNEVLQKTGKVVALKVSQGRCAITTEPICFLGNLAPGARRRSPRASAPTGSAATPTAWSSAPRRSSPACATTHPRRACGCAPPAPPGPSFTG